MHNCARLTTLVWISSVMSAKMIPLTPLCSSISQHCKQRSYAHAHGCHRSNFAGFSVSLLPARNAQDVALQASSSVEKILAEQEYSLDAFTAPKQSKDARSRPMGGYPGDLKQGSYSQPSSSGSVSRSNGSSAVNSSWARKTKLVCTIGPATSSKEELFKLADAGMNVARLNMSHGSHESHKAVIDLVRAYNATGRGCIATMLDTKGPEVRSGDLAEPLQLGRGQQYTFTITEGANGKGGRISVNYDGFIDDVSVGDELLVDGGIMSFVVKGKTDTDVTVEVVEGGKMESRRHLNVRGKSATLPAITDKDWLDLKFGVDAEVDYFALSFVKDAQVILDVKNWLAAHNSKIKVLAKIESADSVKALDEILDAVDGAMVARGDLGAELPLEDVPYWQNQIVQGCRRRGKPVIVATNMLESMISNPAPTRAEVSDIAIAVREGADAIMLSGETAYGKFPLKAVATQSTVAIRTEAAMTRYQGARRFGTDEAPPIDWITPPSKRGSSSSSSSGNGSAGPSDSALSEMFAYHSTTMANTVGAPLLVFSRQGGMPALLSHYRPNKTVFAFTDNLQVQRHLALYHGVIPLLLKFTDNAEETFDAAMSQLVARGYLSKGQVVALVQSGKRPIWRSAATHTIQVRRVEAKHMGSTSSLEDD